MYVVFQLNNYFKNYATIKKRLICDTKMTTRIIADLSTTTAACGNGKQTCRTGEIHSFLGRKTPSPQKIKPHVYIPDPAKVSSKVLLGKNCVNSKKIYIPMNILKEIVKNIVIKNRREREIKKEP